MSWEQLIAILEENKDYVWMVGGVVVSWEQLIAILEENKDYAQENPVESCPNDGEPLKDGPNGELYCPFDGWVKNNAGI